LGSTSGRCSGGIGVKKAGRKNVVPAGRCPLRLKAKQKQEYRSENPIHKKNQEKMDEEVFIKDLSKIVTPRESIT